VVGLFGGALISSFASTRGGVRVCWGHPFIFI
jgi:hypothetical protein